MVYTGRSRLVHNPAGCKVECFRCVDLVNQRVPFTSSHSRPECRQHAVCPDVRLSPLGYFRCLSLRCSPEGHCEELSFWFRFALSGHSASTFLPPFAPPVYVARLHRYYEGSDCCLCRAVKGIASACLLRSIPMLIDGNRAFRVRVPN